MYYRRGAIVARLMRLRRSASQMKHDPFTLMVVFLPIYLLYELGIKFSRD